MKTMIKTVFTTIVFCILSQACSVVPITGRKQLSLVPESEMISMSLTSYTDFLKANTLSTDKVNTDMVKKVGSDIAAAVTKYFADNNLSGQLDGYQWEFNLVKNDTTQNAWCMPGGKVVVYSGILPVTKDKNGLAVVLSHEIAHAVARHGNERMSQELLVQFGGIALNEAIKEKPERQKAFSTPPMALDLSLEFYFHIPVNMSLKQTSSDLFLWLWQDMTLKRQFHSGKEWHQWEETNHRNFSVHILLMQPGLKK